MRIIDRFVKQFLQVGSMHYTFSICELFPRHGVINSAHHRLWIYHYCIKIDFLFYCSVYYCLQSATRLYLKNSNIYAFTEKSEVTILNKLLSQTFLVCINSEMPDLIFWRISALFEESVEINKWANDQLEERGKRGERLI